MRLGSTSWRERPPRRVSAGGNIGYWFLPCNKSGLFFACETLGATFHYLGLKARTQNTEDRVGGGGGGGEERLGKLFRGKSVLKNFSFPFYTSLSIDLSIYPVRFGFAWPGLQRRDVREEKACGDKRVLRGPLSGNSSITNTQSSKAATPRKTHRTQQEKPTSSQQQTDLKGRYQQLMKKEDREATHEKTRD